jgi:Fe-S cluster biogenesis protein NfuA
LQSDGGDMKYISFNNNTLKIKISGACTKCDKFGLTFDDMIKPAIKAKIPIVKKIIFVKNK